MIIVDLDNCISDDGWRVQFIDWSKTDPEERYQKYHEKCSADNFVNQHLIGASCPLFFTSRPEKYREFTTRWLIRNKIEFLALLMRPEGNHMSSVDLKEMLLAGLALPSVEHAYDDREDVVAMYRRNGIEATVVKIHDHATEEIKMSVSVPEILIAAAQTYDERSRLYGDNYKRFGSVMTALFPEGLMIKDVDEWNRIGLFVQIISKTTRYAANFDKGGHIDSAHDLAVYAAMLQELTENEHPANRAESAKG